MVRSLPPLRSKRLVTGAVIFGLFVIFDIALFGWLIVHSLSQQWIERALSETREEAEPLARELVDEAKKLGQEDLYVVVSATEQTQTFIRDVLTKKELVHRVEILDRDGNVVYKEESSDTPESGPTVKNFSTGELPAVMAPAIEDMELPIGDLGTLVVGLSEEELSKRTEGLRRDLIRQATLIGVLTLLLLAAAYVAIWKLFLRTRQLEGQAQEAERLAYVGTLASGLAHEIRNPLNSLNLNMQMLEEEMREAQAGGRSSSRLLALTRSELSRLERLATDFLSYAKPRTPELEELLAVDLLNKVAEVLAAECESQKVELVVEDLGESALVRVDRGQMDQLLLNLTRNALAALAVQAPPKTVRLRAQVSGAKVCLEVIDNGPGIPAKDREKVFDIFYSTRKGGTGLGLAIVRRIAQGHDADIEVLEATGGGAKFRLTLPRTG